ARRLGNIDADTDQAFAWQPFLVLDPSINAFALPGGYIGVHLGMIAITATPDELASVLAHELSHVTQRHIARGIAPQQRASMAAVATMLLGIFAAARSNNADVANAAIAGSQGAAIQSRINYTRGFEREADRVGFGVLVAAGYSPASMGDMFEKMQTALRLSDQSSFPYLRDHPVTTERISEARDRMLLVEHPRPDLPTLEHALMAARARVLMTEGTQGLQRLAGAATSPLRGDRAAPPGTAGISLLYAEALASSRLNEPARAERAAAQALAREQALPQPDPRAGRDLGLLLAEVRVAAKQPVAALQALDALPPLAEGASERPELLLRAQATLDAWRADPARAPALRQMTETLQTWVALRPQDALAWETLSHTSEALGLKLRALRAAAEARAALGDLGGAVDRLRAAQAASRTARGQDFIEASIIDARMRQLLAQRRELALQARAEGRQPE
ncbi:MAG: M48 family metalloprotease, partial [Burkholderiales bacterium]|nr:M48 family metalloprotease [Burkholderiales bacterium]